MTAGLAVVLVLLCAVGALMGFRDAPNAAALPVRYRAPVSYTHLTLPTIYSV